MCLFWSWPQKVWLFQIKSAPSPRCRNCWACTSISHNVKPANCFYCTRTKVGRLWHGLKISLCLTDYCSVKAFVVMGKLIQGWNPKLFLLISSGSIQQSGGRWARPAAAPLKPLSIREAVSVGLWTSALLSSGSWHFPQKRSFVLCHCCSEYIHSSLQLLGIYTTEASTYSHNFVRVSNQTRCFEIIKIFVIYL